MYGLAAIGRNRKFGVKDSEHNGNYRVQLTIKSGQKKPDIVKREVVHETYNYPCPFASANFLEVCLGHTPNGHSYAGTFGLE